MTKQQTQQQALSYKHLKGKKFQHKGSKKIYIVDNISDFEMENGNYQLLVSASPLIPDLSRTTPMDELNHFLSTHSPIEDLPLT